MEENKNNNKEQIKNSIPDILTLVDKEKFRRKMVWVSKLIALGLVLAIVWFGYVNYSYAKDISKIKSEYGSMAYCYLCGVETLKKCDCQYNYATYGEKLNFSAISKETALYNIQICENKDLALQTNPLAQVNLSNNNNK